MLLLLSTLLSSTISGAWAEGVRYGIMDETNKLASFDIKNLFSAT